MTAISLDDFVGIPWVQDGRDRAGCNCWGLVHMVYAAVLGVDLPTYSEHYPSAADSAEVAEVIAGELPGWDEVPAGDERALDVVLMRRGRSVSHVGLVATPGRVLHVAREHPSRVERYRGLGMRGAVVGFFRKRR